MKDKDTIPIHTDRLADGVVIRPQGDIDLSRAPSLRQQISEVQKVNPGRLIIDLSEVPYMDSSGVATLVEAMQVARRRNQKLILCSPQEKVKAIFEIARLDMVFKIVSSRDEAVAV
jgi:anti-sigma B factor antagonist